MAWVRNLAQVFSAPELGPPRRSGLTDTPLLSFLFFFFSFCFKQATPRPLQYTCVRLTCKKQSKKKKRTDCVRAYLKILGNEKLHHVAPVGTQRALLPLAKVRPHHPPVVEHPHELLCFHLPPLHLAKKQKKKGRTKRHETKTKTK